MPISNLHFQWLPSDKSWKIGKQEREIEREKESEGKNQSHHEMVDSTDEIPMSLRVDDKIYTSCSPTN